MVVPQWADVDASKALAGWIAAGESTQMEFKQDIPEQRRKLAQEIAAMATSGGGHILLGVTDSGEFHDLKLMTTDSRDQFLEQVQGIVDIVRPNVDADLVFAVTQDNVVLVITIRKQGSPVFYVEQKPYIRDNRRSRPARPEEVVECVWAHGSSAHKRRLEQLSADNMEAYLASRQQPIKRQ